MPAELINKVCVPCKAGTPKLTAEQIQPLLSQIDNGWNAIENHHLEREFRFKNFRQALDFANKVGEIAESQGHHPDIYLAWGKVKITLWTHKIDGLSENDFILAAKVDAIGR